MKEQIPGKRLLLVVPFTKPDYSGSGINAFNFARFLNSKGQKASILTFNRNLRLKRKEILDQVPIHRVTYFNKGILVKFLSLIFILPVYLIQILRNQIVFIYGGHVIAYQLLISWSRFFGRRVIFQSLLLGEDDIVSLIDNKPQLTHKYYLNLFRKIDLYHAINPVFAEKFNAVTSLNERQLICPQGYSHDSFYPIEPENVSRLREKIDLPADRIVLLSAGFIIARKGYRELFTHLSRLDLNFILCIIGEYDFPPGHFLFPEANETSDIIKYGKEILGDRIILNGPVQNVNEFMQSADIFLLHSQYEGLPNVLLEAMACGCSVLTHDLPGIRNFVLEHDRTGLIYKNEEDFESMLKLLIINQELREILGRNAAEFISQFASFEAVWKNLKLSLNEPSTNR